MPKHLQALGIIKKLFHHHWNFLLGPVDVRKFFNDITNFRNLELKKKKNIMLGNIGYLIHTE